MSKGTPSAQVDNVSLLNKFDPTFNLLYLMRPPYTTADEVAYCIDLQIDKAFEGETSNGNV